MYGFCALCRCTCRRRLPASEKRRPQVSHSYGRSPVCVRSCSVRRSFFVKFRPHTSHTYSRTLLDPALRLPLPPPAASSEADKPPDSVGRWSWRCVSESFLMVEIVRERRRRFLLPRLTRTLEVARLALLTGLSEFWQ